MGVLRANRLPIYFFLLAILQVSLAHNNETNNESGVPLDGIKDNDQSAVNFKLQFENILKELNQVDQLIFKNERKLEYLGSIRNSKTKQKQKLPQRKVKNKEGRPSI